ncbi:MAG: type transport system ATP-binding protein [Frankiales bacterium]|nr:type transport system ATP-binding protein [Frankiales bacterium]
MGDGGAAAGPLPAAGAVVLERVSVRRGGSDVLRDVNAVVPVGQIMGLVGPSGCGKTTVMRSVVGVQAGVRGTVTVLGQPAGAPALRSLVGYVTQAPAVYLDLTVLQNLRYFGRVLRADAEAVDRTLQAVDLRRLAGRRVGALSGGERARVSLATALLNRPPLLVLDEPTVGLDPVLRTELWSLFRRLADAGTTLLVSSHVMDEASRCDALLLVRDGAVLATGTPTELLARTSSATMDEAFLRLVQDLR